MSTLIPDSTQPGVLREGPTTDETSSQRKQKQSPALLQSNKSYLVCNYRPFDGRHHLQVLVTCSEGALAFDCRLFVRGAPLLQSAAVRLILGAVGIADSFLLLRALARKNTFRTCCCKGQFEHVAQGKKGVQRRALEFSAQSRSRRERRHNFQGGMAYEIN